MKAQQAADLFAKAECLLERSEAALAREGSEAGPKGGRQKLSQLFGAIIPALLTGAVVAAVVYVSEQRAEQHRFEVAQEMEDERLTNSQRVENLRFLRSTIMTLDEDEPMSFVGIDLAGVSLEGLDLSESDFTNANLAGVRLANASFNGAKFADTSLIGATTENFFGDEPVRTWFRGALFYEADLSRAKLEDAELDGAIFNDVKLRGGSLAFSYLADAAIVYSDLSEVDLTSTWFIGGELSQSDLNGALLAGTTFTGTDLSGTDFSGASFSVDYGGNETSFDSVWWNPDSPPDWPEGFNPPENTGPPSGL